jgi:hypothetical protein
LKRRGENSASTCWHHLHNKINILKFPNPALFSTFMKELEPESPISQVFVFIS